MRSVSVDLNNDSSLLIDIPDALCERDKVKFTVHTKVKINTILLNKEIKELGVTILIALLMGFSELDMVLFAPRPRSTLSRSQTSPFHGSMRTLFGYTIP